MHAPEIKKLISLATPNLFLDNSLHFPGAVITQFPVSEKKVSYKNKPKATDCEPRAKPLVAEVAGAAVYRFRLGHNGTREAV